MRRTKVQAAALPTAGLTAWHALTRAGALRPDATVLTEGTGGVALFALQLAVAAGATVIATSSTSDKLARLRKLGALAGVNYRQQPDWADEVVALTGGAGVDFAIDIGGATSLNQSIRATAMGGAVSVVGLIGGLDATINLDEPADFKTHTALARLRDHALAVLKFFDPAIQRSQVWVRHPDGVVTDILMKLAPSQAGRARLKKNAVRMKTWTRRAGPDARQALKAMLEKMEQRGADEKRYWAEACLRAWKP